MSDRHQIRLLPVAEDDLDEIVAYVALDNLQAALKLADHLEADFERLSGFPRLGRIPRDGDLSRVRISLPHHWGLPGVLHRGRADRHRPQNPPRQTRLQGTALGGRRGAPTERSWTQRPDLPGRHRCPGRYRSPMKADVAARCVAEWLGALHNPSTSMRSNPGSSTATSEDPAAVGRDRHPEAEARWAVFETLHRRILTTGNSCGARGPGSEDRSAGGSRGGSTCRKISPWSCSS